MSAVDPPGTPMWPALNDARVCASARPWVYLGGTATALLLSYLLGKEMMWDTLDYHVYAGFSALCDRFGMDYFAAGTQSYLNPYVYVPFYALVRSGMPALWAASILAGVQSVIFWLTYELALVVAPSGKPRVRLAIGICATLLAVANPILINQLGSSYVDILTAELVLAGWLLLIHAVRGPRTALVVFAGLLLGVATALKLSNATHAISACVLLLFLPGAWRGRVRFALGFGGALVLGFAVVTAPWAIQLQHHFGNPFFPLLNSVFRSPQFPTDPMIDERFVPVSLGAALWRPFAIATPVTMVNDEYATPDLRYALLLGFGILLLARWGWRRLRRLPEPPALAGEAGAWRACIALGCAFLSDWILWLRLSGNGRYFIAMACVAGVLAVAFAFRAFGARPKVLGYLMLAVFLVQGVQLFAGSRYRLPVAWDGGPWFEVSVPPALASEPNLYLTLDEESNSYIAPFLARGSGLVNLEGDYVLSPDGPNGMHVESLIRKYWPHIRVAEFDERFVGAGAAKLPHPAHVDDTLSQFGLRADTADCATIPVHDMRPAWRNILPGTLPIKLPPIKGGMLRIPESPTAYVVTCRVVRGPGRSAELMEAERGANLVFDRLEDACPELFRPKRLATELWGDGHTGYIWIRKYQSTNLVALIVHGSVEFVDGARGGRPDILGRESDWLRAPQPLTCGTRREGYHIAAASPAR